MPISAKIYLTLALCHIVFSYAYSITLLSRMAGRKGCTGQESCAIEAAHYTFYAVALFVGGTCAGGLSWRACFLEDPFELIGACGIAGLLVIVGITCE